MKNILVPIDFSPFSHNAAKAAVFIAEKTHSAIHLLHVVSAPEDWNKIPVQAQQQYADTEAKMVTAERQLESLAAEPFFDKLTVRTYVQGGAVYDRIASFARERNMDLIAIGAHGVGETDNLFIGSTTQRVIHVANCPVLSVKKSTTLKSIGRILFVSDFEEDVAPSIQMVKELADIMDAEVDLLFVNNPANFTDTQLAEQRMVSHVPENSRFNSFIYNDYDKESGMLNFMKRRRPDLVAMVTHGRRGKPAYWMSVTDTLLFHSDVPVLSMVLQNA